MSIIIYMDSYHFTLLVNSWKIVNLDETETKTYINIIKDLKADKINHITNQ
jgi:hypothetical protein